LIEDFIIEKISKDSLTYGLYKQTKNGIELLEDIGESFDSIIEVIKEIILEYKIIKRKNK